MGLTLDEKPSQTDQAGFEMKSTTSDRFYVYFTAWVTIQKIDLGWMFQPDNSGRPVFDNRKWKKGKLNKYHMIDVVDDHSDLRHN